MQRIEPHPAYAKSALASRELRAYLAGDAFPPGTPPVAAGVYLPAGRARGSSTAFSVGKGRTRSCKGQDSQLAGSGGPGGQVGAVVGP